MFDRFYDVASSAAPSLDATSQREAAREANGVFGRFFDETREQLLDSSDQEAANRALDQLFGALHARLAGASEAEWHAFVAMSRHHPLMEVLHRDPFTFRAFSKPRGYAGDAEMMDFIYGREDQRPLPEADRVGRRIFDYTTLAPASEGVRARRAFVASQIDRIAEIRNRPHILSIASGHLREASVSVAVRRRRTGRFLALD
ncbi:MAG TPA: hypothetical protein VKB78_16970, partial [Pirellulales bacterium]|nr:hypothetical protein [Pirellulales bacterium]